MATNVYFQSGNTSGTTNEQRLVEDLVIESLKIYGQDVHYMPRTLVNRDTIFDEDELSKFTQQYPLEMYMENVEGYEGEGELFTRFGIEIRDQATFVLSKRRWEQMVDREEDAGGTFQLNGVHYQNNVWLAVGGAGMAMNSVDGSTWYKKHVVSAGTPLGTQLNSVTYGDNKLSLIHI